MANDAKDTAPKKRKSKNISPPPEIVLPFEKKDRDMGEMVYDRRIPIFITVIIYLILAIIFVSSKIMLERRDTVSAIIIDIEEMEQLVKELEDARKLNDMLNSRSSDSEPVRNLISNEEGELDENQRDRPSTETEKMMEQVKELERRMQENRDIYEQDLMSANTESHERRDPENSRAKPIKVEGKVTVYYSIKKPARHAVNLFVPSYQCRKGGRVMVDVVVNNSGEVIAASVVKAYSEDDWCMQNTAVKAAYRSRFNADSSAPSKHEGRIIYTFVQQ